MASHPQALAAARIKEAQLKEKPERREWEAAPSFFKWTCGNYPPVREARALEDFNEKLTKAQAFRQAGNALLAEAKLEDALMQYSSRVLIFHPLVRMEAVTTGVAPLMWLDLDAGMHMELRYLCGSSAGMNVMWTRSSS